MSGGEESDHVRLPLQSNPGEDLTPQLHDYIQVYILRVAQRDAIENDHSTRLESRG